MVGPILAQVLGGELECRSRHLVLCDMCDGLISD